MKDGYTLVWADEFDYEGRPDPKKWNFDVGMHWHNNEQQAYTDRLENAQVRDGKLHLYARKEPFGEREYTSARMTTFDRQSWQYGYFEIRAKIPDGIGSWPAFWFMPDTSRQGVRWPLCGEIDMMEHTMAEPDVLVYSLHCEKLNHTRPLGEQRSTKVYREGVSREFRTYGMEWTPDSMEYFLDGESVCRYEKGELSPDQRSGYWPFEQPFFLILNIAVGGFMGGPIRKDDLPYEMIVDYVRVYQKQERPASDCQ